MKKEIRDYENGVWRTIGGRRVFIRNGESLPSAMKRSGKFERKQKIQNYETEDRRYLNDLYKENKISKEQYDNATKSDIEHYSKRLKGKDELPDIPEAYRHYENDYENELRAREYGYGSRKMPEEKDYLPGGKKWNKEWESAREVKLNKDKFNKLKEESNNIKKQTDNVKQEKYEYNLYKRAKENPDSIDPMTENSTDWEALDRKYSDRYKEEYIKVKRYPDDYNNHEYISVKRNLDEKLKVPRASGAKDFSEYGIRIEDEDVKTRFSDYLRDKYGTDDFRIISYDDSKKAQNIYSEFNKQELKAYQDRMLNSDEYLAKNNPGMYLTKLEKEASVRTFADDITLMDRYKGTYEHLQKTTNMSGTEILELLKKIDEDKK